MRFIKSANSKISESTGIFLIIFIVLILVGIVGFGTIANLSMIDSFHNSTLYIAGMGPWARFHTTEAKLFSSFYTIICRIFFIIAVAFIIDHVLFLDEPPKAIED